MLNNKRIACVIPARLKSTRFPEKLLRSIHHKPILQWIWESASRIPFFDEIIFAVDAPETASLVQSFGGPAIMTSPEHPSGTDRLTEIVAQSGIQADIWVNWQGDEPFISEIMVRDLLATIQNPFASIWTLKQRITNQEDIASPHIAKVVCNEQGNALFFSRSPIPYYRDNDQEQVYYKHIGMYAFTTQALHSIAKLKPSPLEQAEKLEQLRWLEHQLTICVNETNELAFGIDLPGDLEKAEKIALKSYKDCLI